MRRAALLVLTTALLACGPALAAPPAAAPPAANPPPVSPLTVFPKTEAPKVVKTFPAAGQALPAGVMVLSITFDQPMLKTGFDYGTPPGADPLSCVKTPRLLNDNKTFVLLCTSEPGKTYGVSLNAKPSGGFVNQAEHRADPMTLSFKTTDADGPTTLKEAMKVAGLGDIDVPIQEMPDLPKDKPGA